MPSILTEMRLIERFDRTRLGAWLTGGYEAIEWLVMLWGIPTFLGAAWSLWFFAYPHFPAVPTPWAGT